MITKGADVRMRRRWKAHTIRVDRFRQYREVSFLDDYDDLFEEAEPVPKREREFVNLSPDVPLPGRVCMVPASREDAGQCPVCHMSFHSGDTVAIPDDHQYLRTYRTFHAACWKMALDDKAKRLRVAPMAELVFGGGLS